jgi:hypothetical protein
MPLNVGLLLNCIRHAKTVSTLLANDTPLREVEVYDRPALMKGIHLDTDPGGDIQAMAKCHGPISVQAPQASSPSPPLSFVCLLRREQR